MMSTWYERQTATPEARRDYERERLLVEVAEKLYAAMEDAGLNKADIARVLHTSRAHVTQSFSGTRNLTLRSISDLAWALGQRITIALQPLRDGQFISAPAHMVRPCGARVVRSSVVNTPASTELGDNPLAA